MSEAKRICEVGLDFRVKKGMHEIEYKRKEPKRT